MKNRNQKIIHYENESNQTFLSSNLYYCIAADAGMHKPAFAALMKHVKEADNQYRTVIMVQVQNEVGILGSPRDHSPKAEEAFYSAVPQELINYLSANQEKLLPETSELWAASDYKTSGSVSEESFNKLIITNAQYELMKKTILFDFNGEDAF